MSRRRTARSRSQPSKAARNLNAPSGDGAGRPADGGASRGWAWLEQDKAPFLLLAVIAMLAYANAWPNNLVFDDKYFLTAERFSGLGLADLLHFFREDVWAGYGARSGLYRPLFAVVAALQWKLFGTWPAGFHLVNIALHAGISLGVFSLLNRLLQRGSEPPGIARGAAFLAAAVFAVHPVHTEVVDSIFNGSELWASLGVIGGLLWLLRHLDASPLKAWSGLVLIYFLAMLMRETAVVLPAIAVLAVLLYEPGRPAERLRRLLPATALGLPLALYLALRMHALAHGVVPREFEGEIEELARNVFDRRPDQLISWENVGGWVQSWTVALKLWLWPHPLKLQHPTNSVPMTLSVAVNAALWAAGLYRLYRGRPGLAFGLGFFYVAIFPASLFMGSWSAGVGMQERFLYLPSVGLSMVLGLGLQWLATRRSRNLAVAVTLAALLLLTPLTWARNAVWSGNVSLFEAEYDERSTNPKLLGFLVLNLIVDGDFAAAARYCDRHQDLFKGTGKFAESCGQAYGALGRLADAEKALLIATEVYATRTSARQLLGQLYVRTGDFERARDFLEEAVRREKVASMRELRQAQMLVTLYPDDPARRRQALQHIDRALELQPRMIQALQLREKLLRQEENP